MKKIERFFPLIILLITLIYLAVFYQEVFFKPNSILISARGDGIKNAFTLASHAKEPTIIHYSKMNYPYGESMFYLDCHPALTVIIKGISKIFPWILNYSIGIMNFLMLTSIALTALLIYLIIIRFGTNKLFALAGAFGISMLQPQIVRFTGHYALSYSVAIPLTWYLYLRFQESSNPFKWSVVVFLNNLFWFLIHAYLGMIVTAFILIVLLWDIIFYRKRHDYDNTNQAGSFLKSRTVLYRSFYLIIQAIAPIVIFYLTIKLTDNHTGRSDQPYGILYYVANFESVFLPNSQPLVKFFSQLFKIETNWEGWSYIGMGTILILLVILINNLLKFSKRRIIKDEEVVKNRHLVTAFISSVLLLLLSMGYPFKAGMEFLLEWFPIINNFRGIGRFAWPFYFIITCIAVIYAGSIIGSAKYKIPVFILMLIIPASYIVEGVPFQRKIWSNVSSSENYFSREHLPVSYEQALRLMDTSQYQAILPLPYYNVGCEEYKLHATDKITLLSMALSYHSGIPLFTMFATNTSINESKNLIQVLSPDVYQKEITKDIKSRKPFIIAYSGETLKYHESVVLSKATMIYRGGDIQLYSLSYDDLLANKSNEHIADFGKIRGQLFERDGYLIPVNHKDSYFQQISYDDTPSEKIYYGAGALTHKITRYNLIANIDHTQMEGGKEYVASFWLYTNPAEVNRDLLRSLIFVQNKTNEGKIEWISSTNPAKSLVINGSWALIELPFKMPTDCSELTVYLNLDDHTTEAFTIDEFLLYEKGVDVYRVLEESGNRITVLYKNNHFIRSI